MSSSETWCRLDSDDAMLRLLKIAQVSGKSVEIIGFVANLKILGFQLSFLSEEKSLAIMATNGSGTIDYCFYYED